MTSVPSATTWGSPTSAKQALLIHGLTSSSHTWHRVALSLAVQGYFVTAPNLIGHGCRVSTYYSLGSIAADLRPYLEGRNYSLVVGHSLGALATLALSAHLPLSHPTAIVLIDPPLQGPEDIISLYDKIFADSCANPKRADAHCAENPLWKHEDGIFRELGTHLCSVDAVHSVFGHNKPWDFLDHLKESSKKWKVTALVADPKGVICQLESFKPYSHIRTVVVPGAGHWIQNDFPDVVVEEALKTVAELETV